MKTRSGRILGPSSLADTDDRDTTFVTEDDPIRDEEEAHEYINTNPTEELENVNKRGQGDVPCPCKDTENCHSMFYRLGDAQRHAKKQHKWINPDKSGVRGKHPCPCRESHNCYVMFLRLNNANKHATNKHGWDNPNKRGQGTYPCPCEKTKNCDLKYTTPTLANQHAREKHGWINPDKSGTIGPYQCPCKDSKKCNILFTRRSHANEHAAKKHGWVRPNEGAYTRKRALEEDGGEPAPKVFKSVAMEMADESKGSFKERKIVPCPLAKKSNCKKMFTTKGGADQHVSEVHGIRMEEPPCPEEGVDGPALKVFKSESSAEKHARKESLEKRKTVPCPLSERYNCQVTFVSQKSANYHVFDVHTIRIGEYHCPEDGCDQVLYELFSCEEHLRDTHGLLSENLLKEKLQYIADTSPSGHLKQRDFRFQCPARDSDGCLTLLQTPWMMENHVKTSHPEMVDPDGGVELIPACENDYGPKTRRKDGSEAPERKKLPQPKKKDGRWICQDRDCKVSTAYLQSIWIHYLAEHMDVVWPCPHAEKFGCDEVFHTPVFASKHGVDHYWRFKCPFASCLANARGLLLTNEQMLRHRDDHKRHGHLDGLDWNPERVKTESNNFASLSEGTGEDSYDPIIEEFMETMSTWVRSRTIVDYSELLIDPNDPQQQNLRTRIASKLGTKCMGPSKVQQLLISELCADDVVFAEDNIMLHHKASIGGWVLSKRCKKCHIKSNIRKIAETYDIKKREGQIYCKEEGCNAPIWLSTALCQDHILAWRPTAHSIGPDDIEVLQGYFQRAASNAWRLNDDSMLGRQVFRRMESGALYRSETPLVVSIDIEADIKSGRVFQIGICDLDGRRHLDCQTVLSEEEVARTSCSPGSEAERWQRIFDESARSKTSADGFLNVDQVADRLKEIFPCPEEVIFISWATWEFDLSHVRDWLENAGHSGILPGNEMCWLVLKDYTKNIDRILGRSVYNGKRFPLRLPVLFPVVMGESHNLVGKNHHALYDARQLALLVKRLASLCGVQPANPAPT